MGIRAYFSQFVQRTKEKKLALDILHGGGIFTSKKDFLYS
jgi:hypothetical protein